MPWSPRRSTQAFTNVLTRTGIMSIDNSQLLYDPQSQPFILNFHGHAHFSSTKSPLNMATPIRLPDSICTFLQSHIRHFYQPPGPDPTCAICHESYKLPIQDKQPTTTPPHPNTPSSSKTYPDVRDTTSTCTASSAGWTQAGRGLVRVPCAAHHSLSPPKRAEDELRQRSPYWIGLIRWKSWKNWKK
ncbi:hypothetical protein K458DRAFT_98779 [Lentithecium fluviatile CBS 122367]|uniref:Uncharacterized protein n=1 Tax=Lentithecium fluviatile CBS 122367 TaxID=1168545 RepID=A0A6G1JHT1_9PLEO|nr:hypothetical protein K458DRAFT_98779 [Lentithecium fluviatile CBS 122367]